MNPNLEYERLTQEIYQQLVNLDVARSTSVKHNVKLEGRSGQKHQIDVYWEYEIAGNKHKVAIECKNYNSLVSIGKVRDFKGVLDDLNGVNGIMVTKVGYQEESTMNKMNMNQYREDVGETPFLLQSFALQLCDIVLWYRDYVQTHTKEQNWEYL